jgi:hypothetical protein
MTFERVPDVYAVEASVDVDSRSLRTAEVGWCRACR